MTFSTEVQKKCLWKDMMGFLLLCKLNWSLSLFISFISFKFCPLRWYSINMNGYFTLNFPIFSSFLIVDGDCVFLLVLLFLLVFPSWHIAAPPFFFFLPPPSAAYSSSFDCWSFSSYVYALLCVSMFFTFTFLQI